MFPLQDPSVHSRPAGTGSVLRGKTGVHSLVLGQDSGTAAWNAGAFNRRLVQTHVPDEAPSF